MLPIFDLSTDSGRGAYRQRLARLIASSALGSEWAETAQQAIEAVRQRGDDAVVDMMRRFTDPDFTADRIGVTVEEIAAARYEVEDELLGSIARAIENVQAYQQHILPNDPSPMEIEGATLGMRFSPIHPVGLCVPGGSAVLFSTLVMLAVPAMVAGVPVDEIAVISPPPTRQPGTPAGDISPITLATAHMLGITRVYRIGGPAAIAALALGTRQVRPVNFIAGPGHPVTQAAKLQLQGVVGIDGFYGASEIVTLADDSADPKRIAADLIAQAEHDPGKCFLVGWQQDVLQAIVLEVEKQVESRHRQEAIRRSLETESCAMLVEDEAHAASLANELAGEHVNLAVRDPRAMLQRVQHGGEFFLGDTTPVASGDYYAGPSHCLPTGTTARFSSGVSVYTFLKRSGIVHYENGMPQQAIEDIARMAEAEGLDGHAASVRARK